MTSSITVPNIAPACNSGKDWRQVQALEAPVRHSQLFIEMTALMGYSPQNQFRLLVTVNSCYLILIGQWPTGSGLLLHDKEGNPIPLFLWKRALGKSGCMVPSCPIACSGSLCSCSWWTNVMKEREPAGEGRVQELAHTALPLASWGRIIYNKIFCIIVICSFSPGYFRETWRKQFH